MLIFQVGHKIVKGSKTYSCESKKLVPGHSLGLHNKCKMLILHSYDTKMDVSRFSFLGRKRRNTCANTGVPSTSISTLNSYIIGSCVVDSVEVKWPSV